MPKTRSDFRCVDLKRFTATPADAAHCLLPAIRHPGALARAILRRRSPALAATVGNLERNAAMSAILIFFRCQRTAIGRRASARAGPLIATLAGKRLSARRANQPGHARHPMATLGISDLRCTSDHRANIARCEAKGNKKHVTATRSNSQLRPDTSNHNHRTSNSARPFNSKTREPEMSEPSPTRRPSRHVNAARHGFLNSLANSLVPHAATPPAPTIPREPRKHDKPTIPEAKSSSGPTRHTRQQTRPPAQSHSVSHRARPERRGGDARSIEALSEVPGRPLSRQ